MQARKRVRTGSREYEREHDNSIQYQPASVALLRLASGIFSIFRGFEVVQLADDARSM